MEQNNFFTTAENQVKELEGRVQSLFSEILYLKLAMKEKKELNFLNSTGIMLTRLTDVTKQWQKILTTSVTVLKEIKAPSETMRVMRNQLNEANKQILQFSNALTNTAYFIKQNIYSE